MKNLTFEYLDCCYSDYFAGYPGNHPILAIPVYNTMNVQQVREALREESDIMWDVLTREYSDKQVEGALESFLHGHEGFDIYVEVDVDYAVGEEDEPNYIYFVLK
jgi:hypothetical protein